MAKTLWTCYVLWFFGGWFGLHHIYLRRDRQAFLWFCTLGGGCGFGWFRDIVRIPEYVQEANNAEEFILEFKDRIRSYRKPRKTYWYWYWYMYCLLKIPPPPHHTLFSEEWFNRTLLILAFNTLRFVAELVIGALFGFLIRSALPESTYESSYFYKVIDILVPYAVAVGKIRNRLLLSNLKTMI